MVEARCSCWESSTGGGRVRFVGKNPTQCTTRSALKCDTHTINRISDALLERLFEDVPNDTAQVAHRW
jgi:hypothetical protein